MDGKYMTEALMREKLRQMGETDHRVSRLKRKKRDLQRNLDDVSLNAVQIGEKTSGGKRKDSTGDKAVKRIDWAEELAAIDAEILRLVKEKNELSALMDAVLTEDENAVLTMKWVEFQRWEQVARKMHMSRSSSFRMSNSGLKKMVNAWNRRHGRSEG